MSVGFFSSLTVVKNKGKKAPVNAYPGSPQRLLIVVTLSQPLVGNFHILPTSISLDLGHTFQEEAPGRPDSHFGTSGLL